MEELKGNFELNWVLKEYNTSQRLGLAGRTKLVQLAVKMLIQRFGTQYVFIFYYYTWSTIKFEPTATISNKYEMPEIHILRSFFGECNVI